jgi:hypothetical protein
MLLVSYQFMGLFPLYRSNGYLDALDLRLICQAFGLMGNRDYVTRNKVTLQISFSRTRRMP